MTELAAHRRDMKRQLRLEGYIVPNDAGTAELERMIMNLSGAKALVQMVRRSEV